MLHLRIRASGGKRHLLVEFLRQARPFYESPGGIRMRLLEDTEDEDAFIEVFEYQTIAAYEADEQRVANDPKMRAMLEFWRGLLDGPPQVEIFHCRDDELAAPDEPDGPGDPA